MTSPGSSPGSSPIPFRDALLFWLKLGFISFGGPAGQIALMHQELVDRRRWISERRFLHALNYCMVLPGPEAQQLATYLGWLMHRTLGGVFAGIAFVLPSLLILIALSWIYLAFGETFLVSGLFYGIKPAVTAIVAQACWRIGGRTLKHPLHWGIAAGSFAALLAFALPFPLVVAIAALIGHIGGRMVPAIFQAPASHGPSTQGTAPALIDDHTPPPEHARFAWSRLLRVVLVGLVLWAAPMAALTAGLGWQHDFTQMGWFFSKAAVLTFGGAYAVLPYVYQGAVGHYGWLSPSQMIDGLALGETTPGPLIMVVAFVGFVGGYMKALCGPEHLFLAGALAATLVSWFTFLPSIIFILAGGPLVEATHDEIRFTAPLVAITAAVVGVILNLALFFAYHVFWPAGLGAPPDLAALAIGLLAGLALFRYRLGVIPVLASAAGLGLLTSFAARLAV